MTKLITMETLDLNDPILDGLMKRVFVDNPTYGFRADCPTAYILDVMFTLDLLAYVGQVENVEPNEECRPI